MLATIAAAEEVRNPSGRLIEQTISDSAAPLTSEMVAAFPPEDEFDVQVATRKGAVRVGTALERTIAKENVTAVARRTQANILLELAQSAKLFHAPDGTGFADLDINRHRETWPIRSRGFRRWLTRRFFEQEAGAPSSEALKSALNLIEAKADFDAPERHVHIRVGELEGKLYLDLGDEAWRAVEIDSAGWRVIDNPPVRFRRSAGMLPLALPVTGGSIKDLRSFLNVDSETDFVLVVAWALACLRNCGPYPVLALAGEQGSAKSTFTAILRSLLDPNTAPLRALPREDRDLFIAANNSHVLAFDNVSGLPAWISDTLCRLATGGGFAVRQLYADQDEVLFDATRPVILNGIEEIIERPDLADRALLLTLQPIPEERRRPEQELWVAFEAERPKILGALLDAVATGLKRLPETRLEKLPRMADFALWATACEAVLWPSGTFLLAYRGNLNDVVEGVLERDPVAVALRAMMEARTVWTGTATNLLEDLTGVVSERMAKSKSWPTVPHVLSGKLRRAATFLRKSGINVEFDKDKKRARTRTTTITKIQRSSAVEKLGAEPSAASAPSDNSKKVGESSGFSLSEERTQNGNEDDVSERSDQIVRDNSLEDKGPDAADASDATLPVQSAPTETPAGRWSARL
ncbi:hypothetical protein IVB48_17430 [Bradyrhizobium sp. 76]|nr:hypothetical protein [Bradyrhizobium sp. 76]